MGGLTEPELESARVTRTLRDDILLGRRPPGARLIERDIAAELHVSRLPVREAIRTLMVEGVVTTRPRRWAVVREFTVDDLRDIAELRRALETVTFELATMRHDAAGLDLLRTQLEIEERAAALADDDGARVAAARFHSVVIDLSRNEMLRELVDVFFTRMRWFFAQHEDLRAMAADHRGIFEAMVRRDADEVRALVSAHLDHAQDAAEQRLLRYTQASSGA